MLTIAVKYRPFPDQVAKLPAGICVRRVAPQNVPSSQPEANLITDALNHPIGSLPLPNIITTKLAAALEQSPEDLRVVVLCDDHTRVTPLQVVLPFVFETLLAQGILSSNITLLVAGGSHRLMTLEELEAKFGSDILSNYNVVLHDWENVAAMASFGEIETIGGDSIEVKVDPLVKEADILIGVGNIIPHEIAGFAGGYKIIIPGISTQETVGKVHWLSTRVPIDQRLGTISNPIRDAINEGGALVGLDFLINTVLNRAGEVVGVFCGDPIRAHAEGCNLSRDIFAVPADPADIVITDCYPEETDFWTSSKAVIHAKGFVRERGTLIVCAACPEGVCPTHPQILEMCYQAPEVLEETFLQLPGNRYNRLSATHCANIWEVLQWCDVYLVTTGIEQGDAEQLGLKWFNNLQDAVDHALLKHAGTTDVLLVEYGSEIMQGNP